MSKTKKSRKKALEIIAQNQRMRERKRRRDVDINDLKTAAFYYWKGDGLKAGHFFFPLMRRLIIEPLKGTEEYRDGERKPSTPFEEQEEEEVYRKSEIITFEELFRSGESDPNAPKAEEQRDEDGYLIV